MQNGKQHNSFPLTWFVGIAAVILALGGATWWIKSSWDSVNQPSIPDTTIQENPTHPQKEPISQVQEQVAIYYWLNPQENRIDLVPKTLSFPTSVTADEILKNIFSQLLAGPSKSDEYTSTIPEGTKLLALATTEEGVKVDLSQEFVSGGGSASMTSRLAQVVYTATSLDSNSKVWITVEGKPLEILGGEGITVSQPMTRDEFQEHFTL